jgi:hypothetical protein
VSCDDVLDRLNDGAPGVAEHLELCPSCRAFERDGRRLAEGLRSLAARPERPRRWLPLAAAAALLLGVAAFVLRPDPAAAPAAEPSEPILESDEPLWGAVVAVDPAEGRVAVSAGANDRVLPGQRITLYRRGGAAESEVGTLVIDRVEETWASGLLTDRRANPRAGDFFVTGRLLTPEERAELLDYLFTCRPVPSAEFRALLARPPDAARLLAFGAPLRIFLETEGADLATQVRVREALAPADELDRRVRLAGLDHDVEFLSRLRDPRARARLRAILPAAPEGPALHAWWAVSKDRFRWDPMGDRYERR